MIFSDDMPEDLILNLKEYIKKFANVEVVDVRCKSIKYKKLSKLKYQLWD